MKGKLYLAGAINGKSDDEVFGWRHEARTLLQDIYEIHDPSERDFRGIERGNEAAIVEPDLEEIAQMDALLVRAEAPSWGTAMEVRHAFTLAKRIVSFGAGAYPSPWLLYHTQHYPTLHVATTMLRYRDR